jgi:PAS domain S-box-containing protein
MPGNPEAETLLETIVEGLGQPFYAVDRDWRYTIFNDEAARYFGLEKADVLGRRLWDVFPHEVHAERGSILLDAMARREIVQGETLSMVKSRLVAYCMFPLGDGMGVIFRDVTDRKRAEERGDAAEEALRKRTMELEAVLETVPTAVIFTYDPRARSLVANRRAIELLRLPRRTDVSLSAQLHGWPDHRFRLDGEPLRLDQLPLQRAVRGEAVGDEILEVEFDDGERLMLLVRSATLRSSRGEIQGAVCAMADVTERLRYEEHLKLMLNELNHRVKNTLAIVQSIATLTLKDVDPAALRDFEQRLLTLSAVHSLLTDASWDGAQLHAVVRASLMTHLGGRRERLLFEGEDFRMRPKSAIALSIALNELGTNAVKYGALSADGGTVAVRWTTKDCRFRLRWEERGGPVVAPPRQRGFGSRMIERGLAAELRGEVHLDYRPEGVICTIDAPIDSIRDGSPAS